MSDTILSRPGFAVYFARHGETAFNVERRYQGSRHDSPLTERGRVQAREVGLMLRDLISRERPPHFVASPLGRTRATMEIILDTLGLPGGDYTTDRRVVEIDLGEWSGLCDDEVRNGDRARWQARERDKWNIPVPGGESYAMVARRATDWFQSLSGETVAISHGAFGRNLRGLYGAMAWQDMAALDEPHGCVFRLQAGTVARFE